jgi:hypothetical protein
MSPREKKSSARAAVGWRNGLITALLLALPLIRGELWWIPATVVPLLVLGLWLASRRASG